MGKIIKILWNSWNSYCYSSMMIFTILFFTMVVLLISEQWLGYGIIWAIIITRLINYAKTQQWVKNIISWCGLYSTEQFLHHLD